MSDETKDPVCEMRVDPHTSLAVTHGGRSFVFCSQLCLRTFQADPRRYGGSAAEEPAGGSRRIAYFSMEVAADAGMPLYSGGLGVLAGDALRSCADLKIPVVAVSLLYWNGYFDQRLDQWGNQRELPVQWEPGAVAQPLPGSVQVTIDGRPVTVRAWQYDIRGCTGHAVPLVLLDTRVDENHPDDRGFTAQLYGGDERYRLAQEIILGVGGIRTLRHLGYTALERFHLNEGHAALLAVELLRERSSGAEGWDFSGVRQRCVFTTHTPVPAGHDQFSYDLVRRLLGEAVPLDVLRMLGGAERLNMTRLAMNLSQYVNGVAKKHGEVSQAMFPGYPIDSITNGVHSRFWTCDSFAALYDRYMPGWVNDPFLLRNAVRIANTEIWDAHAAAKARLIAAVKERTGASLSAEAFTIGFARRATAYKRPGLIFHDVQRLKHIGRSAGPMQILFAGKAHPRDEQGKELIREVFHHAHQLSEEVKVAYLENYDIEISRLLVSGVDLWLNTPHPPFEASGTSGMKAAHNGVPSLSILDGWWIEGNIEGVTGWSIGSSTGGPSGAERSDEEDARALYEKLQTVIVPLYRTQRDRWVDVMRHCIALNASFFNSHRMVQQYAAHAYV